VRQLAERLRNNGVDVTLDQWDLRPGEDVTAFMEHALSLSSRVLIVCTDQYVQKSNTLKGGVGYERMIITAEIAKDLESDKFIPLIRNTGAETLPKFLAPKLYLDFRTGDFDHDQYEELLRTLLGQPKYPKPPVGNRPNLSGPGNLHPVPQNTSFRSSSTASMGSSKVRFEPIVDRADPWHYHWHRSLHLYCGYRLYLILIRFASDSIIMRDSVLEDLRTASASNYMIFHLYSQWDILIRVWADESTAEKLKNRLIKNTDIHKDRQPEFLMVNAHTHFADADSTPDGEREVERILGHGGLASLHDVQEKGKQSNDFGRLEGAGLILNEKVGFDPERIQFYITIRSLYPLEAAKLRRLETLIANWTKVRNRSIYITGGSSIGVVVKSQADDYYDINEFLNAIARELESCDVVTETILVANREVRTGKRIDLSKADRHIIERELRVQVPEIGPDSQLLLGERLMLTALYVGARDQFRDDKDGILVNLIRAKASGSAGEVARIMMSFFPSFEEKLKQGLFPVILRIYGNEWHKPIDDLKSKEGIQTKSLDKSTLGDLCKIYKRMVLDKRVVDFAPLSDAEFSALMDEAPEIRNKFAHKSPDMKQWESLFSFCSKFIPISRRIIEAIER
jgi:hypothetical protein